jgi:hypothetical protein
MHWFSSFLRLLLWQIIYEECSISLWYHRGDSQQQLICFISDLRLCVWLCCICTLQQFTFNSLVIIN